MTAKTCRACELSKPDPRNGVHFEAGCFSCKARALAATAAHSESARTRRITTEYRRVLQAMFEDQWEGAHIEVKRWADLMKGNRTNGA